MMQSLSYIKKHALAILFRVKGLRLLEESFYSMVMMFRFKI